MAKLNGIQLGDVNGRVRHIVFELGIANISLVPVIEKIGKAWDKLRMAKTYFDSVADDLAKGFTKKDNAAIFESFKKLAEDMEDLKLNFIKILLAGMEVPPKDENEMKIFIIVVDQYLGDGEVTYDGRKNPHFPKKT